jgi:hypothetical protein
LEPKLNEASYLPIEAINWDGMPLSVMSFFSN